jgi:hypothetical protein
VGWVSTSGLGKIIVQHYDSLPMLASRSGVTRHGPWVFVFVGLPAAGAVALAGDIDAPGKIIEGLLAGVGVLGGLLFQVLAWINGRLGAVADGMDGRPAAPREIELVNRLDIARANTSYASLVSIVFVIGLGLVGSLRQPPEWTGVACTLLLLHFGLTLLLVLVRINTIGSDDRVSALTAQARARSDGRPWS